MRCDFRRRLFRRLVSTDWYAGHGDQARDQSQELLAFATDTHYALRDAQQVAGATGASFAQTTLVRPCSASRNRLIRTRMSGGVGRAISDGGPYPISTATPTDLIRQTSWRRAVAGRASRTRRGTRRSGCKVALRRSTRRTRWTD